MSIRFVKVSVVMALLVIFAGCMSKTSVVKHDQMIVDVSSSSFVLLPVKISNQNKPDYQPLLTRAVFTSTEGVWIEQPFKSEKNKYNEYLLIFKLKPGTYTLGSIQCGYDIPFLLAASCEVPMNKKFVVKPNTVSYLGHVDATIRKRSSKTERRAGNINIDEAIAGFSSGTFDVSIVNNYDEDVTSYCKELPALRNVTIEKNILSDWQRPETNAAPK